MAQNAYYEIYLHLVWHTKGSAALLRGPVEACTYRMLTERIRRTKDVFLDGLGGTDTHVHLAVHIAPTVLIVETIGELKGGSSHDVNDALKQKALYWQTGYGAVSFGKRNLPFVLDYIRNQREHHAKGTVIGRLEYTEGDAEAGGEAR